MDAGYRIAESVFIVWGGNHDLAVKVSNRIHSKGMHALVGGSVERATENYFMGARILGQMDKCTHAIILADPTRVPNENPRKFRENLMFEWGYLLGRLPPQNVSVYLLNCERSELPSDLHGAYSAVVPDPPSKIKGRTPSRPVGESFQARFIADDFLKSLNDSGIPSAFDVLVEWAKWREFIENQLTGKISPQPRVLRKALLYSFLPLSHYGESIDNIDRWVSFIDLRGEENLQDFTLLKGLADFFDLARNANSYEKGDFDAIKNRFSDVANPPSSELGMLVRYLMGQCLMSESFHRGHDFKKRLTYLGFAASRLEEASNILSENFDFKKSGMKKDELNYESSLIWGAYIHGNLAKVRALQGDIDRAARSYRISLDNREKLQLRLDIQADNFLSGVFKVESLIHELRMREIQNSLTDDFVHQTEVQLRKMEGRVPHQFKVANDALVKAWEAVRVGPRLI